MVVFDLALDVGARIKEMNRVAEGRIFHCSGVITPHNLGGGERCQAKSSGKRYISISFFWSRSSTGSALLPWGWNWSRFFLGDIVRAAVISM